jgi:hypothetical protein
MINTDKIDFQKSWIDEKILIESPEGIGKFELYDMLKYDINDLISNNFASTILKNINGFDFKKIELTTTIYYWFEKNGEIILGSELEKNPQSLIVHITGKNSNYRRKFPYASDLYALILNNSKKGIRLMSDVQLSDEGYNIWKKLFKLGCNISVYDRTSPGRTFKTFDKLNDFDDYFKNDDTNFQKYQFILTEEKSIIETLNYFNIQRYRELCGLD